MHVLLLTVTLFSQTAPPLVPADDAPPVAEVAEAPAVPIVEEGKDEVSRSTWRIHFSAGGGLLGFGSSPGAGNNAGAFLSIGKPLYVGDRHRRHQWVTDSTVFVGYAPGSKTAVLLISPTMGTNFYFGPFFGLEWRAGAGFGATPGLNTNVGLGITVEGSLVFRPFENDQHRIKLQAQEVVTYGFIGGTSILISMGVGLAFEMPL